MTLVLLKTTVIFFVLVSLQPTRYAHSSFIGHQNFMLQLIALKKNSLPLRRGNLLIVTRLVNEQFTAVAWLPIGIQIANHRELPTRIVLKLIQMLFIKTPRFIQGIMKLITRNPSVTLAI